DPRRIEREALALEWLPRLAPPGTITPLLFLDRQCHLLAMEEAPRPHDHWKALLLNGTIVPTHLEQFGRLLASIHEKSRASRAELEPILGDRTYFGTLRIDPYYRFTADQVPKAKPFLMDVIGDTQEQRLSLVHGDYSPKNVLVHKDRLILLDHEVVHFGDSAF